MVWVPGMRNATWRRDMPRATQATHPSRARRPRPERASRVTRRRPAGNNAARYTVHLTLRWAGFDPADPANPVDRGLFAAAERRFGRWDDAAPKFRALRARTTALQFLRTAYAELGGIHPPCDARGRCGPGFFLVGIEGARFGPGASSVTFTAVLSRRVPASALVGAITDAPLSDTVAEGTDWAVCDGDVCLGRFKVARAAARAAASVAGRV
jgi:hypothetical protein